MKLPRFLPQPGAWASAIALFFYAGAVSVAMAAAGPAIAELMKHSPRLGWLAVLAMWVAPIGVAGALHHTAHRVLDLGDKKKVARRASSVWAGFVAWATILVVSFTTALVMLVIDPPPIDEAISTLAASVTSGVHGAVRIAIWVVLAAYVYTLERAAHASS